MEESSKSDVETNQPIRSALVDTAVKFLRNPDVKDKDNRSKLSFLRKKGLSESEITAAFDVVEHDPDHHTSFVPHNAPFPAVKHRSFMSSFTRNTSSFIVFAVALYGMHKFYKLYMEPWLFGRRTEEEEQIRIEKVLVDLTGLITELKNSVSILNENIGSQKQQIERVLLPECSGYKPLPLVIEELKSEVASLKSILIGRHQFPEMPKVANPSIPVWQLSDSEGKSTEFKTSDNESQWEQMSDNLSDKALETSSEILEKSSDETTPTSAMSHNSSIHANVDSTYEFKSGDKSSGTSNGTKAYDDDNVDGLEKKAEHVSPVSEAETKIEEKLLNCVRKNTVKTPAQMKRIKNKRSYSQDKTILNGTTPC